ncbi:MAG: thioredoxin family protein, partial [Gammaproteobacteria bacterium]|nr:thioredoxin family protein [Gammaproteobacteria bacterium]
MKHALSALLCIACLAAAVGLARADDTAGPWRYTVADGSTGVYLYFFWRESCPHCRAAHPFIAALAAEYDWLALRGGEIGVDEGAAEQYAALARQVGERPRSVPAFLYCGRLETGYDSAQTTGATLRGGLLACRAGTLPTQAPGKETVLPLVGQADLERFSLPLLTVMLAGMDAFNPCAFFVLLFLLSLMIHGDSRRRLLLVGGVFVLCSGLTYFAFTAAWLNLFLLAGNMTAITLVAGLVAIVIGLINIKDFFWFKRGITLSVPEAAQRRLGGRMARLINEDNLVVLLGMTVLLALVANLYELLCTAGFPMVFTRALTLHELSTAGYYAYLALYNLVYVIPMLII